VRHIGMCEQFGFLLRYFGPVPCAFPFGHDRVSLLCYTLKSGNCSPVAFAQSLAAQQLDVSEVRTETAVIETALELELCARV
jgi:hypothetical protein